MEREFTAADVRDITFTRPPMGKRGYREQEVDDFLDAAAAALDGRGRLSADDVHEVEFTRPPRGERGYDEQEVDDFLDIIEGELRARESSAGGAADTAIPGTFLGSVQITEARGENSIRFVLLVFSDALVFAEAPTKKQLQEVERTTALAAGGEISSQDAGSTLRHATVLPIRDVSRAVHTRSYSGAVWGVSKLWFEIRGGREGPTWLVTRKARQSVQQLLHGALGERFEDRLAKTT